MRPFPFTAAALALLGAFVFPACGVDNTPRTIRATEADGALLGLWRSAVRATAEDAPPGKVRDWQMKLSTWLPSEWPPTPQTVWTRYAYGLDVTLDGVSGVSEPFARVERRAGEGPNRVIFPMARKLKAVGAQAVRPHAGWRYTLDDEKRILAHVLSLTAAPPAEPAGAQGLVAYYKSWQLGSSELAAQVAPRHRAFFAWLKAQP